MKLEEVTSKIIDSPKIINVDAGLLLHKGDTIEWLSYELENHIEIYLYLDNRGNCPYRNVLVSGSGCSIEAARENALKKFIKTNIFSS